eukprot:gene13990-15448_t
MHELKLYVVSSVIPREYLSYVNRWAWAPVTYSIKRSRKNSKLLSHSVAEQEDRLLLLKDESVHGSRPLAAEDFWLKTFGLEVYQCKRDVICSIHHRPGVLSAMSFCMPCTHEAHHDVKHDFDEDDHTMMRCSSTDTFVEEENEERRKGKKKNKRDFNSFQQ